jgi:hypothetical protein
MASLDVFGGPQVIGVTKMRGTGLSPNNRLQRTAQRIGSATPPPQC